MWYNRLFLACVLVLAFASRSLAWWNELYEAAPEDTVPFWPIVVPLAVRGPYLGAYLTGRTAKNLQSMSPHFWSEAPLGWTGLLRVDGQVHNWMGNLTSWPVALNTSFANTAADTTFVMTNGDEYSPGTVALTATFLSPTTPDDLFRQSLPFSYLSISVKSLDGKPHDVQVYTDINGMWTCNMEDEVLKWEVEGGNTWDGLRFRLKNQREWQEENDRLLSGDVYYVSRTTDDANVTVSAGHDATATRAQFAKNGTIPHWFNSTYRPIMTRDEDDGHVLDEPVFAISHDFGTIKPGSSASSLLSVGYVRDHIVRYAVEGDTSIPLKPYWASRFKSNAAFIEFFLRDFETARTMSLKWNRDLYEYARKIHSESYGHIVAVSTRQIFMALEAAWDERGHHEEEDYDQYGTRERPPMLMLKEISSNGNCQTVDVIAPFLPFMVYASPTMLTSILEPIYRYVRTGLYRPIPPPHDMGDHYPNATGRNDFIYANLPIEEAGNMLAMALAGVQLGGEGQTQARRYYSILRKWAVYLESETLYPGNQRSTDDFFGASPNQTSLVIKGITGLRSMSEIARVLGHKADQEHFYNISRSLTTEFLDMAISSDGAHLLGAYGKPASWMTQYNLYYDKLLGTNIFPASVYDMQDAFYPKITHAYGPPLDSRFPSRAKTDWLLWTAGASTLRSTRDIFVKAVYDYFQQSRNSVFGDSITPDDGWSVGFLSRPVSGGHFSLLALDVLEKRRKAMTRLYPALPTIIELKEHAEHHRWMYVSFVVLTVGLVVHLCSRRGRRASLGRYKRVGGAEYDRELPPLPFDMPRDDAQPSWSPSHAKRRSTSLSYGHGVPLLARED